MLMSPQIIENDANFNKFVNKRKLKESTSLLYARRLNDFCKFIEKTPNQLIEESQKEQNLKAEEQKVYNFVEEYITELKDDGKSITTIKNRYDTLRAFFKEFDIETPNINSFTPQENLKIGDIPEVPDIRKAIQISGFRDKAIILLHFTSGMGAIELRNLTYLDFINSIKEYLDFNPDEMLNLSQVVRELDGKDIIGTWKLKKIKSRIVYTTFNTPESNQAILDYLQDRERNNKPIKSLNDPLFVNTRNKPLAKIVHGAIFKRINDKADFQHLYGKRRFFTAGTLRKSFSETLKKSKLDDITIDFLLGYKLNKEIETDFKNNIESIKNQYITALGSLSLYSYYNESNSEFEQLMARFNEKDKELEQIKEQLKYLEKRIKLVKSDERQA